MEKQKSILEQAQEYVIALEDKWVKEQWVLVDQLEKRAKGSKTLIARKELDSAKERLSRELDRLCYADPDLYEE